MHEELHDEGAEQEDDRHSASNTEGAEEGDDGERVGQENQEIGHEDEESFNFVRILVLCVCCRFVNNCERCV